MINAHIPLHSMHYFCKQIPVADQEFSKQKTRGVKVECSQKYWIEIKKKYDTVRGSISIGGSRGARPPYGSRFFRLTCKFSKHSRLGGPRPPL